MGYKAEDMTMYFPIQYKDEIIIHRLQIYDDYCMWYEYFRKQHRKKKAGEKVWGWQIAKGNIPLDSRSIHQGMVIG